MPLKFISFCPPMYGGVYRVEKMLREGLKVHGVEMRWLGVGRRARQNAEAANIPDHHSGGEFICPNEEDERKQAKAVYKYIIDNDVEGVVVSILGPPFMVNLLRYLPEEIFKMIIVHTTSPSTYSFASVVKNYINLASCVSPRIRHDLISQHGFDEEKTVCIPNALDSSFITESSSRLSSEGLRLLFLGRIEDGAKGVFLLPTIMRKLSGLNLTLTVAGDGPDLPALKEKCRQFGDKIIFLGRISYEETPSVFSNHDVLIAPSRYEGFGLTLIEAMSKGCVPVASRILGVTDFIIKDRETGLLFTIGSTLDAADKIRYLYESFPRRQRISEKAIVDSKKRFTQDKICSLYMEHITNHRNAVQVSRQLSIDSWSCPRGLKPGIRYFLPQCFKNFLRTLIERWK